MYTAKEGAAISDFFSERAKKQLLDGFISVKNREVKKVENVSARWIVNEERSDRKTLVLSRVFITARVMTQIEDGLSSEEILLRTNEPVEIKYNFEEDCFEFEKINSLFFDISEL